MSLWKVFDFRYFFNDFTKHCNIRYRYVKFHFTSSFPRLYCSICIHKSILYSKERKHSFTSQAQVRPSKLANIVHLKSEQQNLNGCFYRIFGNVRNFLQFRFYVKSIFVAPEIPKNGTFDIFEALNMDFAFIFVLSSVLKFTKNRIHSLSKYKNGRFWTCRIFKIYFT